MRGQQRARRDGMQRPARTVRRNTDVEPRRQLAIDGNQRAGGAPRARAADETKAKAGEDARDDLAVSVLGDQHGDLAIPVVVQERKHLPVPQDEHDWPPRRALTTIGVLVDRAYPPCARNRLDEGEAEP